MGSGKESPKGHSPPSGEGRSSELAGSLLEPRGGRAGPAQGNRADSEFQGHPYWRQEQSQEPGR